MLAGSPAPIVPDVHTFGCACTGAYGQLTVGVIPVELVYTNPEGFPTPPGQNAYYNTPIPQPSSSGNPTFQFVPQFAYQGGNTWAFEFPGLNNGQGGGILGLQEIAVPTPAPSPSGSSSPSPAPSPFPIPFSGTITLVDNGLCTGVFQYGGSSPLPYNSPGNFGLIISGSADNLSSPSPGNGNPPCTVIATDNSAQSRQANLQIYYDSSTLTIQSNARRTK
jgi:hypothetical protein